MPSKTALPECCNQPPRAIVAGQLFSTSGGRGWGPDDCYNVTFFRGPGERRDEQTVPDALPVGCTLRVSATFAHLRKRGQLAFWHCGGLLSGPRSDLRGSRERGFGESSSDQKTGAAWGKTCPLISPPGFICVWMFTYQRPENRSVMSWIMSGGSARRKQFLYVPPEGRSRQWPSNALGAEARARARLFAVR